MSYRNYVQMDDCKNIILFLMWLYCYINKKFSSFYTCAICVQVQSVLLKIMYVCIRKSVLLKSYTFGCHACLNIYVVLQLGRHVYFTTELKLEPTYRGGRKTTFQAEARSGMEIQPCGMYLV